MNHKNHFSIAIHVILALGYCRGKWLSSKELSASVGTHAVVIRRLLSKLVTAGILESKAGRDGGVRLCQDPKNICVTDILIAVEDQSLVKLHQSPQLECCPVSCQIEQVMDRLNSLAEKSIRKEFSKITLDQLLASIQEKV